MRRRLGKNGRRQGKGSGGAGIGTRRYGNEPGKWSERKERLRMWGGVPFCPKGWTYQLRKQKERTRQAEKALGVVAAWMRTQEKGAEEDEKGATKAKKEAQKEMSNADCRLTAA